MIVDAHVHVPRLSTLKPALEGVGRTSSAATPVALGVRLGRDPIPSRLDALRPISGVDRALLFLRVQPARHRDSAHRGTCCPSRYNPVRFAWWPT